MLPRLALPHSPRLDPNLAGVQLLYSEWLMYLTAQGLCEVSVGAYPYSRYQYARNRTRNKGATDDTKQAAA